MSAPSPGSALLPEIVFCLYQMLFCACTVQLVIGGYVSSIQLVCNTKGCR